MTQRKPPVVKVVDPDTDVEPNALDSAAEALSGPESPQPAPLGTPTPEIAPARPVPHVVYDSWFPAMVVLPGTTRQVNNVKVFATDTGLYIYKVIDENQPYWFSPIHYDKTPKPRSGMMARNGIGIVTNAGTVTVTPVAGCGCGSAVKKWLPSWAKTSAEWPSRPVT